MRVTRFICSMAVAIVMAGALVAAQGKPDRVPPGPPDTPVEAPSTPPEGGTLTEWVCGWLPVPFLCD